MRPVRIVLGSIAVLAGALAVWGIARDRHAAPSEYRFVAVERGDVEKVVSGTGTLQAITTVQVGTQVSGQIAQIFVDFNDHVTKDQLIARIDPMLLQQEVRAAQANVERAAAEDEQSKRDLERAQRLYDDHLLSETEYNTTASQAAVAKASLKSAQVSLERARQNLGYTDIRAPINGVVLARSVDVGQTVAASFSAPQLFLIAEDLSKMEILTAIDESDIGDVFKGQSARFTVQAFPGRTFEGTVDQIRLQPTSQDNVVSYTVVVSVPNADGKLLPGMTATVEFVVAKATGVLKVPNAAVRFRPSEEMLAAVRKERAATRGDAGDSASARGGSRSGGAAANGRNPGDANGGVRNAGERGQGGRRWGGASDRAALWHLDPAGKLGVLRVKTGISDGQYTEVEGPELAEGMQIISGTTSATATTSASPFQNQGGQRRFGPPGM